MRHAAVSAFKRAYVGQFETLRLAHEVRNEAGYLSDIPEMKLPTEMVKLAQLLILAVAASAATGLLWIATEIKPGKYLD